MGVEQIAVVVAAALAGGLVNGLTGFGTGLTAMGLLLYAVSPITAATLVIVCSVTSQLQTLPLIWRAISWSRVLPMVLPGLVGVPLGTLLLPHIDARSFKIGVGLFLVVYSTYVLVGRSMLNSAWGGRAADAVVGFGGGVLGGLTGFSGIFPVIWSDVRGWDKEQRRAVLQAFNLSILFAALVAHVLAGLLTRELMLAVAVALPGTILGAWIGSQIYRRLPDSSYRQAVMALLLLAGVLLLWAAL